MRNRSETYRDQDTSRLRWLGIEKTSQRSPNQQNAKTKDRDDRQAPREGGRNGSRLIDNRARSHRPHKKVPPAWIAKYPATHQRDKAEAPSSTELPQYGTTAQQRSDNRTPRCRPQTGLLEKTGRSEKHDIWMKYSPVSWLLHCTPLMPSPV